MVPAARPPPSWQQRQEGFDNYLRLIYGSGLLGMQFGRESQQWSPGTLTVERETWDVCALPQAAHCLARGEVSTAAQTVPTALSPQDPGPLGQHFSHPPRVTVPIPPTHRRVHSKASQVRLPTLPHACWAAMAPLPPCDSSYTPAFGPLLTEPLPGSQSGSAAAVGAAPREDDCSPGPAILPPAVQGEGPRQVGYHLLRDRAAGALGTVLF